MTNQLEESAKRIAEAFRVSVEAMSEGLRASLEAIMADRGD